MIWWSRTIIHDQLTIKHRLTGKRLRWVTHKPIKSQSYEWLYTAHFAATWRTYGRKNASRSGSGECGWRSSKKPHRGCALPCPHAGRGHACHPPGWTDTWERTWETWSEVQLISGHRASLSGFNLRGTFSPFAAKHSFHLWLTAARVFTFTQALWTNTSRQFNGGEQNVALLCPVKDIHLLQKQAVIQGHGGGLC